LNRKRARLWEKQKSPLRIIIKKWQTIIKEYPNRL